MTINPRPERVDSATRFIAAPAHAIYRAFVDPDAWPQWLPPEGMSGEILEFDARPGGRYRMALRYRGAHSTAGKMSADTDIVEGQFAELVRSQRVVQLVTFESDDPAFAGRMRMIWSLAPAEGGTEVSIAAEGVPPGISQADHDVGLRSTLENLARFVERPTAPNGQES
jgi:uncharacterized protein YndB with AHSA1/START domain